MRGAAVLVLSALGVSGLASSSSADGPNHLYANGTLVQLNATLGDYSSQSITLTNGGSATDTVNIPADVAYSGSAPEDYVVAPGPDCPGNGTSIIVLAPSASCSLIVYFYPSAIGERYANIFIQGSSDASGAASFSAAGAASVGYYQVDAHGALVASGDAIAYGEVGSTALNAPIVGMASTGNDEGYWLVGADGGIFSYGDAQFYGSTGSIRLNKPIVGMAATPDGRGYWFVASDGGIFAYGDAQFYGSTGSIRLNKPVVGMAPTPDGKGYWLVASDGGIFAYGDAQFYGSTGNIQLAAPIVGMAATSDGLGYWFVASDGGIFNYGDAPFYGSEGGHPVDGAVQGMSALPDDSGYWIGSSGGIVYPFGDAPYLRSNVVLLGVGSVVGMTNDGGPTMQTSIGIDALRADFVAGIHPGQVSAPH